MISLHRRSCKILVFTSFHLIFNRNSLHFTSFIHFPMFDWPVIPTCATPTTQCNKNLFLKMYRYAYSSFLQQYQTLACIHYPLCYYTSVWESSQCLRNPVPKNRAQPFDSWLPLRNTVIILMGNQRHLLFHYIIRA